MAPANSAKKRKASELDESGKPVANGKSETSDSSNGEPVPEFAMIPFKIHLDPAEGTLPSAKRRKGAADDKFGPLLEESNPNIKVRYTVRPGSKWQNMKPYRNFIVHETKFGVGDFILINHSNIPQNKLMDQTEDKAVELDRQHFWPAQVLEVRASDAQHVYLRVFWLYWPDELPMGRQAYHGRSEVVMSNHMETVDAMTVACGAEIKHWLEEDDDDDLGPIFYRQYFDCITKTLSDVRKHCTCGRFYNPDNTMIGCSNDACRIWMHEACVIDDVLRRVYARLVPEDAAAVKKSAIDGATPNGSNPTGKGTKGSKVAGRRTSKASSQKQPWEGKFTASINTSQPGVAEKVTITDERGQDPETWTEDVVCLKCGKTVD